MIPNFSSKSTRNLFVVTFTLFGAHASMGQVLREGWLLDKSPDSGNDQANIDTSRMPAGYTSTLGVADASGTLFTGELDGVGVTGTYNFSDGASWRIDPEIAESLAWLNYDGVAAASDLRLVPRLDVGPTTGTPSLDVTISFDEPVENLRMYLFWLDLSSLQFTGSNTIGINNSYLQEGFETFSYDSGTKTIKDLFVRGADETERQVEDGGVGVEVDFNNGGPTSLISFRITDNSPNITASHDSIRYGFSTIPEPSGVLVTGLSVGLSLILRCRSSL